MATYTVRAPDGKEITLQGPEGASQEEVIAQAKRLYTPPPPAPTAPPTQIGAPPTQIGASGPQTGPSGPQTDPIDLAAPLMPDTRPELQRRMTNLAAGAVRGVVGIGATLLTPADWAASKLGLTPPDRRLVTEDFTRDAMGADSESLAYGAGKLGAEIAGTGGVGGLAARGLAAIPGVARAIPGTIEAVRTFGAVGPALATRIGAGTATGGAAAALPDPSDATLGAVIGGGLPVVGRGAALVGRIVRGSLSPEVKLLADRAKELGVDVPADKIADSAVSRTVGTILDYVPLSGRGGVEKKMAQQMTQAASRLMGENTPNIHTAAKSAKTKLGIEFEQALSQPLSVDPKLVRDLLSVTDNALAELGEAAARPLDNQIKVFIEAAKVVDGKAVVDGQAAYNIKKTLDRLGEGDTNVAWHARQLRESFLDGIERSLGAEKAAAFAQTRQKYSNMLTLRDLAGNDPDGVIPAAKLANLKDIRNEPLRELAQIADRFGGKAERTGWRAGIGYGALGAGAATVGLPSVAGVTLASAAANRLLGTDAMRRLAQRPVQVPLRVQEAGARVTPQLGPDYE